jgi:hypothetical protein
VIAVVGKFFAGLKSRKLTDDAVALDDDALIVFIADDPLAAFDGDGLCRIVVEGDEINERIRPVGGRFEVGDVDHAIDACTQPLKLSECGGHGEETI